MSIEKPFKIKVELDLSSTMTQKRKKTPQIDTFQREIATARQANETSLNKRQGKQNGNDGFDEIYLNSRHPAGFSTVERLAQATKRKLNDVRDYLKGKDSYTLHKRARRTFPRNVTYADTVDDCWQADLADVSFSKDVNQGNCYILCIVDVFSRYAWTIPLLNKKAKTVKNAFETIFENTERRPRRLITDKGGELNNRTLKTFLSQREIEYAHTNNPDTKCAIVERFIGTLRLWLQRIFTHRENYQYTNGVLEDVTHAYNHKKHRTLKMTPFEASQPERVLEVYHNLYDRKVGGKKETPKLKVGDYVRISREKKRFEKGSTWNWSEEIFKITQIIPHKYPVYRIAELETNEELEGTFYSWELNPVKKPDQFKIDYIVKTRGTGDRQQMLVHWRGYPTSSRSWVLAKDIVTS